MEVDRGLRTSWFEMVSPWTVSNSALGVRSTRSNCFSEPPEERG